ncbi:DUF5134 domain-containing protein [Pseudonocardia sp. RS010]|uniref:DUF5134 domain-containing protein n=1 Tax=Pseudonocardia sp. RS010 TaxID=3385979 RepID=UPI0039A0AA4A
MAWFDAVLACVSLGLGLLHLVRLATARRDGRPVAGEAAHAVMGFGMAAMFSPLGDPVPPALWFAAFGASAAWFGALALRTGLRADDAGHHVVCGVTMLFMLSLGTADATGHTGHHGTAAGTGPWVSVVAIVLVGYFAWHVLRCGDRLSAARITPAEPAAEPVPAGAAAETARPVDPPTGCRHGRAVVPGRLGALRDPRAAATAHLVMAAAMAVMLLGMI